VRKGQQSCSRVAHSDSVVKSARLFGKRNPYPSGSSIISRCFGNRSLAKRSCRFLCSWSRVERLQEKAFILLQMIGCFLKYINNEVPIR